MNEMRTFEGGATRNTDNQKLDMEGFFSPLSLEAYARYMHKHRFQADGNVRDSDNWQSLFGEKHLDVCMKSGWRHFFSWWKSHRGYETEESVEESVCALIFNAMAYLHKLELDKEGEKIIPFIDANGMTSAIKKKDYPESKCSVPGCKSCPVNKRT